MRPGRTISVRVLENDSDPDGGALELRSVEADPPARRPTSRATPIEVEVPDAEGEYGFIYSDRERAPRHASAFLTVEARADAPLARPEASDTVLSLSDILDEEPSTSRCSRTCSSPTATSTTRRRARARLRRRGRRCIGDGTIRVEVQDRRRIVPFSVSHPRTRRSPATPSSGCPVATTRSRSCARRAADVQVTAARRCGSTSRTT